jgi:hypothetical protein
MMAMPLLVAATLVGPDSGTALTVVASLQVELLVMETSAQPAKRQADSAERPTLGIRERIQQLA